MNGEILQQIGYSYLNCINPVIYFIIKYLKYHLHFFKVTICLKMNHERSNRQQIFLECKLQLDTSIEF